MTLVSKGLKKIPKSHLRFLKRKKIYISHDLYVNMREKKREILFIALFYVRPFSKVLASNGIFFFYKKQIFVGK